MPRIDRVLTALADPTRRELLRRLGDRPCRAGELCAGFAISRPAVVKHTQILGRAGLVRARKRGRERIYELAPRGRQAIAYSIDTLQQIGAFWDVALNAFKQYVEEKQ
jgi:DNA-binding transcriptional ArsR family regulator